MRFIYNSRRVRVTDSYGRNEIVIPQNETHTHTNYSNANFTEINAKHTVNVLFDGRRTDGELVPVVCTEFTRISAEKVRLVIVVG